MESRIGIAFSGGLTATEIADCAQRAEALGYESVWVAEGHGGDQFAILAACALRTRRVRLGTAISSVFVRTSPIIAMAAATVDELSGGRFVLGDVAFAGLLVRSPVGLWRVGPWGLSARRGGE